MVNWKQTTTNTFFENKYLEQVYIQRCQMGILKNVKKPAEKRQNRQNKKNPFKGAIKCVILHFY